MRWQSARTRTDAAQHSELASAGLRADGKSFLFALLGVTAFVGALGARSLARPLWRDEVVSAMLADRSLPDVWRVITTAEANMAGFYMALRMWVLPFEDTVLSMRMMALAGTMVSVVATTALARRHLSQPAALLCGSLVGFGLVLSGMGVELRSYSWLPALAAALAISAEGLIEEPRLRRAVTYGALVTVSVTFHLVMVLFILSQLVAALLHAPAPRAWRRLLVVDLVAGALLAPLLPVVAARGGMQTSWLQRFTLESLLRPNLGSVTRAISIFGAAAIAVVVFTVGALRTRGRGTASKIVVLDVIVPIGTILALSFAVPFFSWRYIIPVAPAATIVAMRALPGRLVASLGLAAAGAVTGVSGIVDPAPYRVEDLRAGVDTVVHGASPSDGLMFVPSFAQVGVQYYLQQTGDGVLPETLVPPVRDPHVVFPVPPDQEALRADFASHRRIWVVGYPGDTWRPSGADPTPALLDELRRTRRLGLQTRFGDLVVQRYDG